MNKATYIYYKRARYGEFFEAKRARAGVRSNAGSFLTLVSATPYADAMYVALSRVLQPDGVHHYEGHHGANVSPK